MFSQFVQRNVNRGLRDLAGGEEFFLRTTSRNTEPSPSVSAIVSISCQWNCFTIPARMFSMTKPAILTGLCGRIGRCIARSSSSRSADAAPARIAWPARRYAYRRLQNLRSARREFCLYPGRRERLDGHIGSARIKCGVGSGKCKYFIISDIRRLCRLFVETGRGRCHVEQFDDGGPLRSGETAGYPQMLSAAIRPCLLAGPQVR